MHQQKSNNQNTFTIVVMEVSTQNHQYSDSELIAVTNTETKPEAIPKWEGKACASLKGPKPQQVWPLLEDFFGLHKWFPTLTTCLPAEGVSGQPGCVRYCAGFKTPAANNGHLEEGTMNWTKQKLLSIDHENMTFCYSIVDGNVGFNGYVATWRVVAEDGGCRVEWRYEVEPVEGWKVEDLDGFVGSGLDAMARKMEAALQDQAAPILN